MRSISILMGILLALLIPATPVVSAVAHKKKHEFASTEDILRWINGYRGKPDPGKMPLAMRAASELGVFRDMDSRKTGSENMAPIATQPRRPPAATITQR